MPLANGDNRIGQAFIERPDAVEEKEDMNENDEDSYVSDRICMNVDPKISLLFMLELP